VFAEESAIPVTEAELEDAEFAFELDKSRMVLLLIVDVPAVDVIPFTNPKVPVAVLMVWFVRFEMVLLSMVRMHAPVFLIPNTV